ncbi:MAG: hypothetical protein ABR528_07905 [Pseudonocardiaceae bacterium]
MAEVRLKYGVLFASRRVRASATVSICLAIGSPSETVRAPLRHVTTPTLR